MSFAKRFLRTLLPLLSLLLCALPARAGGIEQLRSFISDTRSARGSFEQTVSSRSGRKPQQSSGHFAFQRPGHFRWEYQQPYPQLLVGDGKQLWSYDPELKQATVRKVDAALGATPAALLASDGSFEQSFALTDQGESAGIAWVAAEPRRAESGFVSMRLGFSGNQLKIMELLDNFGQTTRLEFTRFERNPGLDAALFRFVPPPGTDVVGGGEAGR